MTKAKASDTVEFHQITKHASGGLPLLTFHKGHVARFADPDAAPYFVAVGFASYSDQEPDATYDQGQVSVDPATVQNATGLKVADIIASSEG